MLKVGQPTPASAFNVLPKSDANGGKVAFKLSPSPSPLPLKKDYKIIFIDPFNVGRSVIAAALTRMLKEWTIRTGGDWRIQTISSAGFFLKNGCDCVDVLENLEFSHQSYKKPLQAGGVEANETAMAALFDNKSYDYPFKKTVKEALEKRRSKGLQKSVFKDYEFIIVLTAREHDNMIALRKALIAKDGNGAAQKGKGRVLHLGRYLTLDGIPREIIDPPKNQDGTASRNNWNWKVSQIKTAIKGFLKQEMKWNQPDPKAVVKA
jgi:hypothetical protein